MSRAIGDEYEVLAARWLQEQGFQILERNFTAKGGEIDLVCTEGDTLVFVEVRARKDGDHGAPEETIGREKIRRVVHAARVYLLARGIDEAKQACRFDVIAVEGQTIRHFRDAFEATSA